LTGEAQAQETAIGFMPTVEGIDCNGLDVNSDDMAELLKVDKVEWLKEVSSIRNHYSRFGKYLPDELSRQVDALEKRLGQ